MLMHERIMKGATVAVQINFRQDYEFISGKYTSVLVYTLIVADA